MRLIDADATIEEIERHTRTAEEPYQLTDAERNFNFALEVSTCIVNNMPSAQPEIIRCKDCKYNYGLTNGGEFNPDDIVCTFFDTDGMQYCDFCSYAERRTDGTDARSDIG